MARMNEMSRKLLLTFIVSRLKTGKNVHSAIVRFHDKVAKDAVSKKTSKEIITRLEKGQELELVLFETEVINRFQYSILQLVDDKREAFDKLINFDSVQKGANAFYFKVWIKMFLVTTLSMFGLYAINKNVFAPILENMQKTASNVVGGKSFEIDSGLQFIIDNNNALLYIGIFFAVFFLFCLWFYIDTGKNNISLHYKYFRYKAIVQNLFLITIISDLLKIGLNLNNVFKALGTTIEPINLRNNILALRESIERGNNDKFEFELRRLFIDEVSIFNIVSESEEGRIDEGFKSSVETATDYKNNIGDFYKEIFDVIAFLIMTIFIAFAGGYVVFFEINITNNI